MVSVDFDDCYNVLCERGLIHCRNPSCGNVIGSYVEGSKVMAHLFNVREMLFEPELQYTRDASVPVVKDVVILIKFGDGNLDAADLLKARTYYLEPVSSRSVFSTVKPVGTRPPVGTMKRICSSNRRVEPMVKIPKSIIEVVCPGPSSLSTPSDGSKMHPTSTATPSKMTPTTSRCVMPVTTQIVASTSTQLVPLATQSSVPVVENVVSTSSQDVVYNDVSLGVPTESSDLDPTSFLIEFEDVCKDLNVALTAELLDEENLALLDDLDGIL